MISCWNLPGVLLEIRATVKKLNPEPVASENLGDME